jgi:hypothetical protein
MDIQLAAPQDTGFGPGLRLPDPTQEFLASLEKIWKPPISLSDGEQTSFDEFTGQFINADKAAASKYICNACFLRAFSKELKFIQRD